MKVMTVSDYNRIKKEVTVYTNPLTATVDKINEFFLGDDYYKAQKDSKEKLQHFLDDKTITEKCINVYKDFTKDGISFSFLGISDSFLPGLDGLYDDKNIEIGGKTIEAKKGDFVLWPFIIIDYEDHIEKWIKENPDKINNQIEALLKCKCKGILKGDKNKGKITFYNSGFELYLFSGKEWLSVYTENPISDLIQAIRIIDASVHPDYFYEYLSDFYCPVSEINLSTSNLNDTSNLVESLFGLIK